MSKPYLSAFGLLATNGVRPMQNGIPRAKEALSQVSDPTTAILQA